MIGIEHVAWPPAPLRTERLVLRESEARDRPAFIELFASVEVAPISVARGRVTSWSATCPRCPAGAPAPS